MSDTPEELNMSAIPSEERRVYDAAYPLLDSLVKAEERITGALPEDSPFPGATVFIRPDIEGKSGFDRKSALQHWDVVLGGHFSGRLDSERRESGMKYKLTIRDDGGPRPATDEEVFDLGTLLVYLHDSSLESQAKADPQRRSLGRRVLSKFGLTSSEK